MAQTDVLAIVSFSAGDYRFSVEAQQIDALLDESPEAMVAVEDLLGLPLVDAAQRRCLRLGEALISVSEPVELRSLPIDQLYPLPELVARRIGIDGVRALALEENSALLLLDLRALLAQRIASH